MTPGLLTTVERRLGLTPSGTATLAAALAGLVLSRLAASRPLALLAYGALVAVGAAWALGRRSMEVDARRSDLPTRVRAGAQVEVALEVTARRRLATIVLEEELAPALGSPVRLPVPVLAAGELVAHSYAFTPRSRGVFDVGPLVAVWSDPFGLTRRRRTLLEPARVIVHPVVEPVRDRVVSREWEDPPVRPPSSKPWPTGFEFYGMRDYVPGDDPRRIVWRAAARTGKYLVREAEQGITDRVNLYLDTDATHHGRERPSPSLEAVVRVVASLGVRHLEDGFSVSVEANGTRLAREMRGRGQRIALLDALAAVQPEPVPLEHALGRLLLDPRRASHNVVATPHLTQNDAARLRVFLERGTSVMVVLVLPASDVDLAMVHRAATLGCPVVELRPGVPLDAAFAGVVSGIRR